ncbi:putative serine protease [Arthrobacter crystallopoietes BAB-32]|uniref:Putative serine protease n=1 Tax=Arthrobacter crystallopoietes BAB-32 TaxID=1246476 RepID=N1UXC5_9MICC|nr:S8 family serine peptidase [Arthrobacter crystallopoietes]EMY33700.1 putative serine protease [Arthrobacter crystallopoietes BAB-32]
MGIERSGAGRLLAMGAALGIAAGGWALAPASAAQPVDEYIVVLKDHVDAETAAGEHDRQYALTETGTYSHAVPAYSAEMTAAAAGDLAADPDVAYVAPNRTFSLAAQSVPRSVTRTGADESSTRAGDGSGSVDVNIAVIDTGIDGSHPDLNVQGGVDCSSGSARNESPVIDVYGHGTAVAGVAAARDNDTGLVGMAPGAPLWSVRVMDNAGAISEAALLCAFDWVTETRTDNDPANDIAVANVSIGGPGADDGDCGSTGDPMHAAICRSVEAGVTYAVAAGNSGADFATTIPAAYDEVLTATAIGDFDGRPGGAGSSLCDGEDLTRYAQDDGPASFSNYAGSGDEDHTVAGPGVCVQSTVPGGYGNNHGTSFASPAVAGTVALCVSSGTCSGAAKDIMASFLAATSEYNEANPAHGFTGDASDSDGSRFYGYLIRGSVF